MILDECVDLYRREPLHWIKIVRDWDINSCLEYRDQPSNWITIETAVARKTNNSLAM